MNFQIIKKDKNSLARCGIIKTSRGEIHTPAFIPVATQATVKGITAKQLEDIGIEAVLCNTYHLYLRPGDRLVKKMGGLHSFMNWKKPIITDSGGFQVFSLGLGLEHGVGKIANIFPLDDCCEKRSKIATASSQSKEKLVKITEGGVCFRSHIDGSSHYLTPEKSIEIQQNLDADIIFAFDECTSPLSSYEYTKRAMARTHRWAERCLEVFDGKRALFGIVQGGAYEDLRKKSAQFISSLDFDGFGIGGSLGKSKKDMYKVLDWTVPFLPKEKPKHLLGIGSAVDILEAVERGIDTFDCVIPTRLGRNGCVLTVKGNLNLKSGRYLKDKKPIDANCGCYSCSNFSRSYLTHLFRAAEMTGPILATIHNLYFMEKFMRKIRQAILNNKFNRFLLSK